MAARLAAARKRHVATIAGSVGSFRSLRLAAGFSQATLAEKAGVAQSYIARIEGARVDPGTDMIVRLASALDVQPEKVFLAVRTERTND